MSIKIDHVETMGWEGAIRGMRNPLESWEKSDTAFYCYPESGGAHKFGPNDKELMRRLRQAGTDHRKFMRMIHIQMDITAGHTWWAEFDTYKVGTTRNSCSKMHKIHVHPFTMDMFDTDGLEMLEQIYPKSAKYLRDGMAALINALEELRKAYNETHEKAYWRALIDMLPMGYHLRATVDFSYETAANIYRSRLHHKMHEWTDLCHVFEGLPYSELITGNFNDDLMLVREGEGNG